MEKECEVIHEKERRRVEGKLTINRMHNRLPLQITMVTANTNDRLNRQ